MNLTSLAADPENLIAINTLAGMGILTNDDSLVDAALSELLALPLERRYNLDPRRDADYLLIQHHLGQVSHLLEMFKQSSDINIIRMMPRKHWQ